MLGRLCWSNERTIQLRTEQLLGLSVLTLRVPAQARRPERTLKKGAELLRRHRVTHVLTPSEFGAWSVLERAGLRPVETRMLRYMLAPAWVKAQMEQKNIPPEQAVLCLKGEKSEPALERLAWELCPLVRSLVFDIPGGDEAANRLRREMGLPVLPGDFTAVHLTLRLEDGPVLAGAEITLPGRELPPDCDRFLLIGALWENGRIKSEEIKLKLD